ncbi:MAG: hypothetical protein CMA03_04335 [Euryarchaeota archaeon]|nr:hypothetical protein [Euryarchaeota archaeon]|tara:strand:- start:696 stop:1337 length:642 start_codon:yes stop_codon:yes gene_type:complete
MVAYHVFDLNPVVSLLLNLTLLGVICWSLFNIEKKYSNGNKFVILGLLAIIGITGRILMSPIPNVQPVTVIVLLAGIRMGAKESIFLASIIALFSNLILGNGIWTIYQAAAWSMIGCLGALFSNKLDTSMKLILFAGISGVLFNWFVSLSILHSVGFDMLIPYLIVGIPYDLLHVVGNITFIIWLSNPLTEIMSRKIESDLNLEVSEYEPKPF